ncbi:glucose-1-phosphate cytidylyltransferase [Phenylobacterium montanum]|uniref:Glucose-1-phosphate cytidylyltransferase n=1 Tax=Phenylobacterium montanum TaxID=2823693 RepID=A0A975FXD7_9CAUL|nr:glucose-1-phosphate cytidylyltransferase [Caulobacter sp. S6]QUD87223.1 glucose-1-phosphate cytidylyltransferase [Caulobacter sp. S6]
MASKSNRAAGLDALILCGGLGTRLREETEFKPKPMVEIGGRPILWHIMKHYGAHGADRFVLCLGYKGDAIRDYFIHYHNRSHDLEVDVGSGALEVIPTAREDKLDCRVVLAETGHDSLTGRRILKALKHVRGDIFLATYGDAVADVEIDELIETHQRMGKLATVTAVHPSSRFGELAIDGGVIRSFAEKPQVTEGWINGGYFVFQKKAFELLHEDQNEPLETALLEQLARMGELAVHHHRGFWQCMDTFREMQLLNDLWTSGAAPWRVWA